MKKRRIAALLLVVTLLLALGTCKQTDEVVGTDPTISPETTTPPTTTPTTTPAPTQEPEPEWEAGIVRATYLGGLFQKLQRGDTVTVIGEWEAYFIIEGDEMPLFVEKRLLRLETEEIPEEYQGYSRNGTGVYTTAYFRGEPNAELSLNTKVTVLDKKGDWALIRLQDGTEGYVELDNLSNSYIYISGGNSGGSPTDPQDGTDVDLGNISHTSGDSFTVVLLSNVTETEYEEYAEPVSGVILSAETEAYAYMFMRDMELKVTEVTEATDTEEAFCTVWIDDLFVTVPRCAVWMEGDEEYTPWTAYGMPGGVAYTEIQCWHELLAVATNQRIEVIDELTEIGMYVIDVNGTYGYIAMGMLSATEYIAPPPSNDGGSGGNSGNTGWTPPVL